MPAVRAASSWRRRVARTRVAGGRPGDLLSVGVERLEGHMGWESRWRNQRGWWKAAQARLTRPVVIAEIVPVAAWLRLRSGGFRSLPRFFFRRLFACAVWLKSRAAPAATTNVAALATGRPGAEPFVVAAPKGTNSVMPRISSRRDPILRGTAHRLTTTLFLLARAATTKGEGNSRGALR
jgi:hypothetical protein